MRARAVDISFACPFAIGVDLTCRKTAQLNDTRIPGGTAIGKITSAELSVNGDTGEAICNVTMGCAVGYANIVTAVDGTPSYVDASVLGPDVQQFTGQTVIPSSLTDVGYSPPVAAPDDDGLVFPLDKSQIVVTEEIKGSTAAQQTAIMSSFASMAKAAQLAQYATNSIAGSIITQQIEILANANSVSRGLNRNAIYYDAQIKPVNNGPFFALYRITTTKLEAPQGINLEAASTP
jgi:hypothetical protein